MKSKILLIVLFFILINHAAFYSKYPMVNQVINKTLLEDQREGSFIVVNVDGIVNQYRQWKELMPRVRPFYAIKANPLPIIAEVLAALGAGFDCASQGEIKQVLDIGVAPDDVIFSNTFKIKTHIIFSRRHGVNKMTFDSIEELNKTAQLFPNAKQVLRIKVENSKAFISLNSKVGAPEEAIRELLIAAKELKVDLIGVSFHVGTNTTNAKVFERAIRRAKEVFELAQEYGHRMTLLDIGGGFPSGYPSSRYFKAQAKVISKTLDELFPSSDDEFNDIQVIAEPGRYFAGDHPIVVRVYGEWTRNGIHNVYINDGIHQSFLGVEHSKLPAIPSIFESGAPKDRPLVSTTIWGQTCDPADFVVKDLLMPETHIDDALMFEEYGAYTLTWGSTFNGFPKPFPVVAITREARLLLEKTNRKQNVFKAIRHSKQLHDNYLADYELIEDYPSE